VLGPLLYILSTTEASAWHQYADDNSQVYISVAVTDTAIAIDSFITCITGINAWIRASRLHLSPTKMQVIWLGSGHLVRQVSVGDVPVLSTQVKPVEFVHNLCIVIDSHLKPPHSVVLATISLDNCVQLFSHDATKTPLTYLHSSHIHPTSRPS